MEIGTEISQKIRSAIKAKLIELGAYVDDELPDYIMVMVANKKTQRQMTDDLSLFLSSNTEKFTSWLHGLLKKLQSINTGEPSSSKHKVKEKEKHKLEKKKPKPLPSEKPTEKPKTIKPAEAVDSQRPRKSSTGEVGRQRKSSMGETERVKKGDKEKRASLDEKLVRPAEPETTDEIKLSEDTDEFREEAKEIAKKELVKSNSSVGKPPPAKVAKSDRTSDVKKPRSSLEEPSRSKQQSAPERSKERTHSSDSRRKPSSYVGTVKRKYELEEEEEEEYDPLNPAVGSVASVVKGPSRKSSVPKAMQANKSLLMKAVNEAEKSISSSKKVDEGVRSDERPVEVKHRLKTAAGQQLMSRSKRHEMNAKSSMHSAESDEEPPKKTRRSSDGFENLKYTVRNEGAAGEKPAAKVSPKSRTSAIAPARVATSALRELNKISSSQARQHVIAADSEESLQSVEAYGPPLPDTRLVQRTSQQEDDLDLEESPREDNSPDPEIRQLLDETNETILDLNELNDDLRYERFKDDIRVTPSEPQFIVTLDGMDPGLLSTVPETRSHPVQTVKPVVKEKIQPVKLPEAPVNSVKQLGPPKIRPFNISLKDSDDEEEGEEEAPSAGSPLKSPPESPRILERCRFWPACANGNTCQYIHPSVPCKMFPLCKFGDKCMYIHPNCRFDAQCTRHDCPYTHSSKRSFGPTVIHKIVQVPMQPFFPTSPATDVFP
ncbi:zinc finger CCCH domain-containing protein 14-like isoform X3 [Dreissena polymorpha]|uniref:Zinc finger CCCH domain-containing protein 14 n=1 Tax=Dreissena polymorpha TaxID=45954 RepID=A0A9D4L6U1_DREPO|nr:zinc finger CCCH domain-containing protein 14-like isoform X3 [Dreissena polymorpha]KAH3852334.1 hypothetical protein DPMN_094840 [Dreissena polymorpha]